MQTYRLTFTIGHKQHKVEDWCLYRCEGHLDRDEAAAYVRKIRPGWHLLQLSIDLERAADAA